MQVVKVNLEHLKVSQSSVRFQVGAIGLLLLL